MIHGLVLKYTVVMLEVTDMNANVTYEDLMQLRNGIGHRTNNR